MINSMESLFTCKAMCCHTDCFGSSNGNCQGFNLLWNWHSDFCCLKWEGGTRSDVCIYICDHCLFKCLIVVIVIRWGGLIGWGAGQCLSFAMVNRWDGIIARAGCWAMFLCCHGLSYQESRWWLDSFEDCGKCFT